MPVTTRQLTQVTVAS